MKLNAPKRRKLPKRRPIKVAHKAPCSRSRRKRARPRKTNQLVLLHSSSLLLMTRNLLYSRHLQLKLTVQACLVKTNQLIVAAASSEHLVKRKKLPNLTRLVTCLAKKWNNRNPLTSRLCKEVPRRLRPLTHFSKATWLITPSCNLDRNSSTQAVRLQETQQQLTPATQRRLTLSLQGRRLLCRRHQ